jgi:isopropylmalate/homocitrate/citramalate synthase
MTREDIIRMARRAIRLSVNDASQTEFDAEKTILDKYEFLCWFAKEVAADEREICAQICDGETGLGAKHQGDVFAAAIRARGNK